VSSDHLNTTFAALADPTRRAILERLALGEASVMELAEPFSMSLPATRCRERGRSMAARSSTTTTATERELTITRVFAAPRALVFKAWTEPERVKQWWGPRGFTTLSCEMDLRPGGAWRTHSRSPEGKEYAEHGIFREIVPPERIVFTQAWEDTDGKPKHETLVTVTFTAQNGKTVLTFHQGVFESVSSRDSHEEGWSSAFELLVEYLAKN